MTILEIAKQVARQVNDPIPTSITNNDDTTNELLGHIEHGAMRIINDYDWRALIEDGEIITEVGIDSYPLPDDFDSMITWNIYDLDINYAIPIETPDVRLRRITEMQGGDADQRFRLAKNNIIFTFPFTAKHTLRYMYKSKDFVKSQDDVGNVIYTNTFTKDSDVFLLDDNLLVLAAIATRSISLQLSDVNARVSEYLELLEKRKNKDQGKFQINTDQTTRTLSARKLMTNPGGSY